MVVAQVACSHIGGCPFGTPNTQAGAGHYPSIETGYSYIDAQALNLILNPWDYEVMVMENMFGDILIDLTGQVAIARAVSDILRRKRRRHSMYGSKVTAGKVVTTYTRKHSGLSLTHQRR